MSYTTSRTDSCTYTEARARYVMQKVRDDLQTFVTRGHLQIDYANALYDDLLWMLTQQVVDLFEVQLRTPAGRDVGLRYVVDDQGGIHIDRDSGGLNLYGLPPNLRAQVVVSLRAGARARPEVQLGLQQRGWTGTGKLLDAPLNADGSYARGGYGLNRFLVGDWNG